MGSAIEKIKEAQKKAPAGSLQKALAGKLLKLCEDPQVEEIIAQDMDRGMDLAGAEKHLTEYARRNKSGNCYAMTDERAEKLLREYFGLTEYQPKEQVSAPEPPAPTAPAKRPGFVNLDDFL